MANLALNQNSAPYRTVKSRWGGLAFLVFVIVGLVWSLVQVIAWMEDEKQLPLSQLVVQGHLTHLTLSDLKKAVNQTEPLKSFMLQNVDSIQKAISALPWVENVSVRKQWPDTLKVNITEHQPLAIWNGSQLLDVKGSVFDANPEAVAALGLVSLHGPKDRESEVLAAWREMGQVLAPLKLKIAQLALNDRRSWRIVTKNGIRIELGRESRMERLNRFVDLFDDMSAVGREIQYVDLRYDTGAAVGWKEADGASEE